MLIILSFKQGFKKSFYLFLPILRITKDTLLWGFLCSSDTGAHGKGCHYCRTKLNCTVTYLSQPLYEKLKKCSY